MLWKSTYPAVSGPGNCFAGPFRMSQNYCVYIWTELTVQLEVIHTKQRSYGSTSSFFGPSPTAENAKKCNIFLLHALRNALVDQNTMQPFFQLVM